MSEAVATAVPVAGSYQDVLFVTGLHRSGTTAIAESLELAIDGRGVDVALLAEHIPALRELLAGPTVDRGVDARPVTPDMPEEYGFFLNSLTGSLTLRRKDIPALAGLIETLRAAAGPDPAPIVLKNPWDTGREELLLEAFPGCRIVVVRRDLGAVEDSARSALTRYHQSPHYVRALMDDSLRVRAFLTALRSPVACRLLLSLSLLQVHLQVLRLTRSLRRLPVGVVALVSYDELLADPVSAAGYVEHLLPGDALARAFERTARAYSDRRAVPRVSRFGRVVEARLLSSWHGLRERQVSAGVIELP